MSDINNSSPTKNKLFSTKFWKSVFGTEPQQEEQILGVAAEQESYSFRSITMSEIATVFPMKAIRKIECKSSVIPSKCIRVSGDEYSCF